MEEKPHSALDAKGFWIAEYSSLLSQSNVLASLERKGIAIRHTASSFKQASLNESIDDLLKNVNEHVSLITDVFHTIPSELETETRDTLPKFVAVANKVAEHHESLQKSAHKVIDEVSKIKGAS